MCNCMVDNGECDYKVDSQECDRMVDTREKDRRSPDMIASHVPLGGKSTDVPSPSDSAQFPAAIRVVDIPRLPWDDIAGFLRGVSPTVKVRGEETHWLPGVKRPDKRGRFGGGNAIGRNGGKELEEWGK